MTSQQTIGLTGDRDTRPTRATIGIVLITVVVPLLIVAIGWWEMQRGDTDRWDLEIQRGYLSQTVQRLDAWIAANPRRQMEAEFRRNGQLYGGPYAVEKAREALDDAGTALAIERWRRVLPPVTIGCAGVIALLSVVVLASAAGLAGAGRASRDALVRGFSVLHRALPPVLGLQVVLLAICSVTVVAFEAMAILEVGDFSAGSLKVLTIAVVLIGASLWTGFKAVRQLRRTVAMFTPDPIVVRGRAVSAAEAPGLWRLLDDLAGRLGALKPDAVVVGLTGGFFVSSGPKLLQPGDIPLAGRTLYVPLPYLPLLRADELAAIIGHELAHFSGSDTEYSLQFLPIYAGVERSLDAVIAAGTTSAGSLSLLTRPSLQLGIFAMERFHRAVMHWSRLREFAADAAGAAVTTADAAARALLRTATADARIDETLDAAFRAPETAPDDLVAATLRHATAQGLADPAPLLEWRQPHPTDTHPPTQLRLVALGRAPDAVMLTDATLPPRPDAPTLLSTLFADPGALCRTATADFLELARGRALAMRQVLQEAASAVDPEEQPLQENLRAAALFVGGAAIVFVLIGLVLLAVGMPGLSASESRLVGGLALLPGLGFAGWGLVMWRRRGQPFLLLRPDAMSLPGLDRPIAWPHLLDLDIVLDRGRVSTRLLLSPEAPFPARRPGARRITLDPRQRIITFKSGLPRRMTAQAYADLLGRYRAADFARRELAAETVHSPHED